MDGGVREAEEKITAASRFRLAEENFVKLSAHMAGSEFVGIGQIAFLLSAHSPKADLIEPRWEPLLLAETGHLPRALHTASYGAEP